MARARYLFRRYAKHIVTVSVAGSFCAWTTWYSFTDARRTRDAMHGGVVMDVERQKLKLCLNSMHERCLQFFGMLPGDSEEEAKKRSGHEAVREEIQRKYKLGMRQAGADGHSPDSC